MKNVMGVNVILVQGIIQMCTLISVVTMAPAVAAAAAAAETPDLGNGHSAQVYHRGQQRRLLAASSGLATISVSQRSKCASVHVIVRHEHNFFVNLVIISHSIA